MDIAGSGAGESRGPSLLRTYISVYDNMELLSLSLLSLDLVQKADIIPLPPSALFLTAGGGT